MDPDQIKSALRHLRSSDPVMREVIRRVGPFTLKLQRNRFQILVRSIISQQISTSAARSIRKRVAALVAPQQITTKSIGALSLDDLRTAGVSNQKGTYLLDLVDKVENGQVRLRQIGRMHDEQVIEELVQVKGIGRWTAQMFLIFCLGRPDVFPHDDLGIRSALRDLYGLRELPNKEQSHRIAECWKPYASFASWYCWRSGDLPTRSKK